MKKIFIIFILLCFSFLNGEVLAKENQGFFKKLFNREKQEEQTTGYKGTLPKIENDFQNLKQEVKNSKNNNFQKPDINEIDEANLKEAPVNDPLFLDNVVKKPTEKDQYINDLIKLKYAINNLKKCLEEKGDLQRFNASVNLIDLYSKNFQNKYEKTSNSLKESYIDILNLNYEAKILGNLKYNANYYSQYTPVNSGQYSIENIEIQENKLLAHANKTLFIIMNESSI